MIIQAQVNLEFRNDVSVYYYGYSVRFLKFIVLKPYNHERTKDFTSNKVMPKVGNSIGYVCDTSSNILDKVKK